MSAWTHRQPWDPAAIHEYGVKCALWHLRSPDERFDCADLAVELVVEYAASTGRPVVLAGDGALLDSREHRGPRTSFLLLAQRAIQARHIPNPTNTVFVGRGARCARPGHLLVHVKDGRANHIQVVTRSSPDHRWVSIAQGNLHTTADVRTVIAGAAHEIVHRVLPGSAAERMIPAGSTQRPTPARAGYYSPGEDGFGGTYQRGAMHDPRAAHRVPGPGGLEPARPTTDWAAIEVRAWNFEGWNRP